MEQDAGVDLFGAVEVLRQRRVPERDGLLVQHVGRERKGVVGRGAAAKEQQRVAFVFDEFCVGGDPGGAGGGEGGGGGRWGCRRRRGGGGESGEGAASWSWVALGAAAPGEGE